MQTHLLTLNIAAGPALNVTLSDPAQVEVLALAAGQYVAALAREVTLCRVYHMGAKPTPGLDYDDRLKARLKCSADTAYSYLSTPVADGGLRSRRVGNKYLITEQAVREFLGDLPTA